MYEIEDGRIVCEDCLEELETEEQAPADQSTPAKKFKEYYLFPTGTI